MAKRLTPKTVASHEGEVESRISLKVSLSESVTAVAERVRRSALAGLRTSQSGLSGGLGWGRRPKRSCR